MIQLILIELFKIVKRPRTYIGFLAIFLTVGAMQLAMYYEGEELISIAIQNLENDFRLEGKIINTNLMTYILLNSLVFLMTIYTFLYPLIGKVFNSNENVVEIFENTFWIVILAQPFNSIAFTFDGIFKGLGKAVDLRNTLIIGTFLFFIPTIYILDLLIPQLISVWIALSIWMLYRGIFLLVKFRKIVNS